MKRRIVQVAVALVHVPSHVRPDKSISMPMMQHLVFGVSNDGLAFELTDSEGKRGREWVRLPELPQT